MEDEMEDSEEDMTGYIRVNVRSGTILVPPEDALAIRGVRLGFPPEACKSGRALAKMVGLPRASVLYVLVELEGPIWVPLNPKRPPPKFRGEIYIFQVLNEKPQVDEAWGSNEAQNVPPSGMSNSACIKLQAMDKDGNLKDGASPQLLNFRPAYATPPLPAALAHEAFGNFLDVFKGRKGELDDEDAVFFMKLAFKSSRYYKDEAAYKDEISELWEAYAGMCFISHLDIAGGTHCYHPLEALFAALEAEMGMFASKSDPGMQGPQYVRLYWLRSGDRERFKLTCYPALVIEHIGPFVRISAVYLLNKLCFTPLTPFINLLLLQCHDMPAALEGTRLCKATKLSLHELSDFYKRPEHGREQQMPVKTLPYPLQRSKYAPTPLARGKLVFRVQDVVFKYIQGPYGEAVHRAWAAEQVGLAPQLYSVKQLPGGWLQVKMEYLGDDWRPLHGHPQAQELRIEVLKMLEKAHGVPVTPSGDVGVHGDARDVNVMVRVSHPGERVEVKFINFDWAAVEGVGRYPYFMNHVGVNWPTGVSGGQMMLQKHDKELLSLYGV